MDFTLKAYEGLLKALGSGDWRFSSYLKGKRRFILRHDVDRMPWRALRMAILENKHNIRATYYFRVPFEFALVDRVHSLGHEIGYHYECMDKAGGNLERAFEIFREELKLFWKWGIKTIAMHGNPLSRWDNRELWRHYDFKRLGLRGEAYLSVDFSKIDYFTDTGRGWNTGLAVKDTIGVRLVRVKNTWELIEKIKKGQTRGAYLLVHPERWSANSLEWVRELLMQNLKNLGKRMLV